MRFTSLFLAASAFASSLALPQLTSNSVAAHGTGIVGIFLATGSNSTVDRQQCITTCVGQFEREFANDTDVQKCASLPDQAQQIACACQLPRVLSALLECGKQTCPDLVVPDGATRECAFAPNSTPGTGTGSAGAADGSAAPPTGPGTSQPGAADAGNSAASHGLSTRNLFVGSVLVRLILACFM